MQLQTFQGSTMAEAWQRVKTTLGSEAVILHTRTVSTKKWMGLRKVEIYEITAGRGMNVVKRQLPAKPAPNPAPAARPNPYAAKGATLPPKPNPLLAPNPTSAPKPAPGKQLLDSPAVSNVAIVSLTSEVNQLKGMVTDLVHVVRTQKTPGVPEELFEQYENLIENLVADEVALEITRSIKRELRPEMLGNKAVVREKLAEHLEKLIPTSGPIVRTKQHGPHIVALIGPTGVGKTTTIAKIAANMKLREKKKVGLITLDTYRIAAVDQLRTYANIIGVPLKVVVTPSELVTAMKEFSDCDTILIDTAGRAHSDQLKLSELAGFVEAGKPTEVHLVLSSTCTQRAMEAAYEEFSKVRTDQIIFTKLDEAVSFGVLLNVARKASKALSYVTTGQDVPDHIEVGQPRRLARLILGEKL